MDAESALRCCGMEMGVSEELVVEIWNAISPICTLFVEPVDFGIYFHSVQRCEDVTAKLTSPDEALVVLWDLSLKLRKGLEGSIAVEYKTLFTQLALWGKGLVALWSHSQCLGEKSVNQWHLVL